MSLLVVLAFAAPCVADVIARVAIARRDARRSERWLRWMPVVGAISVVTDPDLSGKRRAAALVAGPAAAYVVTACLVAAIAGVVGLPSGRMVAIVDRVEPGMPADGFLAAGDRIASIDGAPFDLARESLAAAVDRHGERPIVLGIDRDGAARSVTVTPKPVPPQPNERGGPRFRIGILPRSEEVREPAGLADCIAAGLRVPPARAAEMVAAYAADVGDLFGGSRAQVRGPVGMAEMLRASGPGTNADAAIAWACWVLLDLALVAIVCLAITGVSAVRARAHV